MTMCDAATQQLIEQVLQEKVQRGEMFTALDVSLETQKRGVQERHRNMRQVVHQYFEGGYMGSHYTRTLVSIPGAPSAAWLYHLTSDQPANFQPLSRAGMNNRSQRARKASNPATDGYSIDRRARVCVPVRLLRQAGFQPGDEAYVIVDGGSQGLALSKTCPRAHKQSLTSYRVDRYGNVRIAQGTLRRASLGGQTYDLDSDGTKILIRLHASKQTT
jgi:hypothetical protein